MRTQRSKSTKHIHFFLQIEIIFAFFLNWCIIKIDCQRKEKVHFFYLNFILLLVTLKLFKIQSVSKTIYYFSLFIFLAFFLSPFLLCFTSAQQLFQLSQFKLQSIVLCMFQFEFFVKSGIDQMTLTSNKCNLNLKWKQLFQLIIT